MWQLHMKRYTKILSTSDCRHPARYQAKSTLVLNWTLWLPDGLKQKLWQAIAAIEGETQMRYVTSVEKHAIQRGRLEGTAHGIEQALTIGHLA